jgi:hypothetical protein
MQENSDISNQNSVLEELTETLIEKVYSEFEKYSQSFKEI